MKCLLPSGGVSNASIHAALCGLLGKPVAESSALCTAHGAVRTPLVYAGLNLALRRWSAPRPHGDLDWRSLGLLEPTALPSIGAERWIPWVREAGALLVDGGDAAYLCHWLRRSGLPEFLRSTARCGWG